MSERRRPRTCRAPTPGSSSPGRTRRHLPAPAGLPASSALAAASTRCARAEGQAARGRELGGEGEVPACARACALRNPAAAPAEGGGERHPERFRGGGLGERATLRSSSETPAGARVTFPESRSLCLGTRKAAAAKAILNSCLNAGAVWTPRVQRCGKTRNLPLSCSWSSRSLAVHTHKGVHRGVREHV